jgi:DNA-binding IclR family transcriptional regulator
LLDEVRRRGSLSTTEAALLVNATPATARGLLDEFVQAGLVLAQGKTRGRRYHLR